jgi:small-conductance mechanosensitive channel
MNFPEQGVFTSIINATHQPINLLRNTANLQGYFPRHRKPCMLQQQEETNYNKQLQKISNNLSALNALYELHLQGSNEQMESTDKVNETMNKLTAKLNESIEKTTEFKQEVKLSRKILLPSIRYMGICSLQ